MLGFGGILKLLFCPLCHPRDNSSVPNPPSLALGTARDPGTAPAALAIPAQPLPTLPGNNSCPRSHPNLPFSNLKPFPGSCPCRPCPQSLSSSPGAPAGPGGGSELSLELLLSRCGRGGRLALSPVPSRRVPCPQGPPRCSSLQAPIMLLSGHEGEVYCCKFHPNGNTLASAGFDRLILLWNVYGDCDNFATLKGHSGAVMELHYNTDGSMLFSASTDKTVAVWDSETGERVKRLKGHTSFVNSCYPARRGPQLVCTGSDDGTVKLWDIRKKAAVQTFQNTYQVLAVTFNDTSDQIISGGIDNDIKVWDLRQNKLTYTMRGHADSVTGLSLSSEGSYLLSNAMDNTVRIWDVRPFAPKERCVKIFQGNVHNFEKNLLRCSWSPDGSKIAGGSADRFVYVWDTTSRRILYKLPGHAGSVNELAFHPEEPIILSASSDKRLYMGEIQ
uniref:U5 small nuclear ribonucleoprotein 40 kDa protein n=18 Tax=Passeriformes TaxID=9126 RepID=A0A8C0UYD3_CYACU